VEGKQNTLKSLKTPSVHLLYGYILTIEQCMWLLLLQPHLTRILPRSSAVNIVLTRVPQKANTIPGRCGIGITFGVTAAGHVFITGLGKSPRLVYPAMIK
jgi:hypothetical protein